MAPVDGIRAPKRTSKRPAENKNVRSAKRADLSTPRKKTASRIIPVSAIKSKPPAVSTESVTARPAPMKEVLPPKEELLLPSGEIELKKRKRLMWLLVIGTALIIFIAWLLFFPTPRTSSTPNSYWGGVGQKLSNIWSTLKTDILHIKESAKNININSDEHVKQLENEVFPQFNDPTKQ